MHDDGLDTIVAGIRCREVLADLSGYLDNDLSGARRAQLQAHLAGCDRCARFGGAVSIVLEQLRRGLVVPPALSPDAAERLHSRVFEAMRR
jgi:anti-sigma factor RsiW